MGYLDQGLGEHYIVSNGRSVFLSPDGTVVTTQIDNNTPGVYVCATQELVLDQEISKAVMSLYQKADITRKRSTKEYVESLLSFAEKNKDSFLPITGVPKLSKGLVTSLHSLGECMTFLETDEQIEFVCFGYRPNFGAYLDRENKAIFLMPDRFFRASLFDTRFSSSNLHGLVFPNRQGIFITNEKSLNKLSIVMTVDRARHSKFLENNLFGDQKSDE